MDISKKLKDLRKINNYKLCYVEEKTGIRKGTISKYENGHSKPSYDNLIKLADFYNVSLDKLCARDINLVSQDDESYSITVSTDYIKIINALKLPENSKFTNYIIEDPARRIKAVSNSYFRIHNI